MLFFRPFYAVPVESVADAGVQNLADVPQVRDLLRGVGVTKTVVIKLVKPKLCAGNMTDIRS